MFAILLSAFNAVLGFVFRKLVIKFLLFGALYWLCTEIPSLIVAHLPDISSVQTLFDRMPDSVIYFANYFYVPQGVTAIISALFVRFFIRRIPFLGG